MRLSTAAWLLHSIAAASAAAKGWSFSAGKLEIADTPYPFAVGAADTNLARVPLTVGQKLKLSMTVKTAADEAKKPHQCILLIEGAYKPSADGEENAAERLIEASIVVPVKSNGRATLVLSRSDFSSYLLASDKPLTLTLVIGGFEGAPLKQKIALLNVQGDPKKALAARKDFAAEESQRIVYGPRKTIHHTFKPDQRMPPVFLSGLYALAALGAFLVLLMGWFGILGANFNHMQKAASRQPLGYAVFLFALSGVELLFFIYWSGWTIMPVLGLTILFGITLFFSGRPVLAEVASRRAAGLR
ncbi:hypothetical protein BCR37DRAFT_318882 [Protomyces lactucae-debilis]|uniref:Ribophorin II C-terminal domain-containing protein n=1 Tax=Protomyces lactucae-debilis TaxID=2754530 RepID=A0A1Y2FFG2_PROLT|nr:uncharacterized protein BCR37DRAFT_318882 [Protomyces lactucae-debilis]ORY82659.1 hypothetical protein BCR37DRAFT_318882 [Protomyces lactucae-debilis]